MTPVRTNALAQVELVQSPDGSFSSLICTQDSQLVTAHILLPGEYRGVVQNGGELRIISGECYVCGVKYCPGEFCPLQSMQDLRMVNVGNDPFVFITVDGDPAIELQLANEVNANLRVSFQKKYHESLQYLACLAVGRAVLFLGFVLPGADFHFNTRTGGTTRVLNGGLLLDRKPHNVTSDAFTLRPNTLVQCGNPIETAALFLCTG